MCLTAKLNKYSVHKEIVYMSLVTIVHMIFAVSEIENKQYV